MASPPQHRKTKIIAFGTFHLDGERRILVRRGQRIILSAKPFDTLLYLVRAKGRLVSKQELIDNVWHGDAVSGGTVVHAIMKLRTALGDHRAQPEYIETVHGEGYRFVAPTREIVAVLEEISSGPDSAGDIDARLEPAAADKRVIVEEAAGDSVREATGRSSSSLRLWFSRVRPGILILAVIGAALAVVISVFVNEAWFNASGRQPAGIRVVGNSLVVLDQNGEDLWQHSFPYPMVNGIYPGGPTTKQYLFADLDQDGQLETLFAYAPLGHDAQREVFCFSAKGEIKWRFTPGHRIVSSASVEYLPPYLPSALEVVPPTDKLPTRVIVSSNHHWGSAHQIAVLDADGSLLSEYWHHGHLLHSLLADLDGDGEPELLLGGVADGEAYKRATLVVFDPGSIHGASSDSRGRIQFQGCERGTERAIVFFPKTAVSLDQEYNRVSGMTIGPDRITVFVAEGIQETGPYVVYELDFNLNVLDVRLSDPLKADLRQLEERGLVAKDYIATIPSVLRREVQVVRGNDRRRVGPPKNQGQPGTSSMGFP